MRWILLLLPFSLSALVQLTGEFLVIKPIAAFQAEGRSIHPDYRPGGRVKLGFLPEMGCSEVWAAGLYVQNRGRNRLLDIEEEFTSVRGSLETLYWYGEGFASYTLLTSDWSCLELLGGGRYVGIEENRKVTGAPNLFILNQSRFSGAGPGVGLRSHLYLGPFALECCGRGFAIIGERKTKGNTHFTPTVVTIPAMELRLAFSFDCGPLGGQIGYMLDYYWDVSAVAVAQSPGARRLRDAGFGGPFFSGRITF
jgi:Legionella pneumophila major outer membrane protein precursor